MIAPRYRTGQIERRPFDPYDYKRLYFQEADATDPNTGSQVHVGLRIVINSGIASCIELVTPTRNDLYTLFPDITKTDQMLFYNRFAIHPSDLVGEWDESSVPQEHIFVPSPVTWDSSWESEDISLRCVEHASVTST